jgi:hypothetical protein
MAKEHHYTANIVWTGNKGEGTKTYQSYDRNYTISIVNKPDINGSADTLSEVTVQNIILKIFCCVLYLPVTCFGFCTFVRTAVLL